jgi:hypothetical protein
VHFGERRVRPLKRTKEKHNVPSLIPSTLLLHGSDGATHTVPRPTDNARWLAIMTVVGCVIGTESVTGVLDSATQLVTVIILLILVRAHPCWGRTPNRRNGQVGH